MLILLNWTSLVSGQGVPEKQGSVRVYAGGLASSSGSGPQRTCWTSEGMTDGAVPGRNRQEPCQPPGKARWPGVPPESESH